MFFAPRHSSLARQMRGYVVVPTPIELLQRVDQTVSKKSYGCIHEHDPLSGIRLKCSFDGLCKDGIRQLRHRAGTREYLLDITKPSRAHVILE
jgi:hypothetical protein